MEEVATKLYEATQDFSMQKYTEAGDPDGEVSYTAGTRYQMPAEVAALAPEGALKEVEETPPTPPTPPTGEVAQGTGNPPSPAPESVTPPAVEPAATAPAKTFVGGHTMTDDGSEGMRQKKA